MATQRYSVTPYAIETLLSWIKSGEIAIPEIQRPFVWDSTKVRNLLDSLYQGFPVGYLISWRNPTVKLKDGSLSAGKRILIDGQQRVTALMAALLGREVVNKDYERTRIRIAFHPVEERFEVANPAIAKDAAWIPDVTAIFSPDLSLFSLVNSYCAANAGVSPETIFHALERLKNIVHNHVGMIDLAADLSIETVTEIFIRVNSAGAALSQADFAMSKIASSEAYGGGQLRKAIDYFCHMAVSPDFHSVVTERDPDFANSDLFQKMSWLRNEVDDIYDPSYTDMLRVAFTTEFRRGRLQDLVALLSGRNFETRQFEAAIAEDSFSRLKQGIFQFINESHFKRFIMIVRSAGFVDASMISAQNALNFAYILYLTLRSLHVPPAEIESAVRRWLVMAILSTRYSASPESTFDYDIRQIHQQGHPTFLEATTSTVLPASFWEALLPIELNTSAASSPYFRIFQAAQVKFGVKGFLSRDITVRDLILNRCDIHHIYPRNLLKQQGLNRARYNQIANYAVTQTEINIAIADTAPSTYFPRLAAQCAQAPLKYGAITDIDELQANLRDHAIPTEILSTPNLDYDEFLNARRRLMAAFLKRYFDSL